jgi:hypothetical protein
MRLMTRRAILAGLGVRRAEAGAASEASRSEKHKSKAIQYRKVRRCRLAL